MDEKLLDIVCCPVSHQPLHKMNSAQIDALNTQIAAGDVASVDGTAMTQVLRAGLVTRDGSRGYAVIDGLVNLLPGAGFLLEDKG
ncbi:MAG: Trm112 family protein [Pseudomonadota bacterium]